MARFLRWMPLSGFAARRKSGERAPESVSGTDSLGNRTALWPLFPKVRGDVLVRGYAVVWHFHVVFLRVRSGLLVYGAVISLNLSVFSCFRRSEGLCGKWNLHSGKGEEKRSVDMSFRRGGMYGFGKKNRTFATDSFRVLFVGSEAVKRFCATRPAKGTVSAKDILQATCRRVIGL